jgi:tetratricopeptide (TPR) repeat protein
MQSKPHRHFDQARVANAAMNSRENLAIKRQLAVFLLLGLVFICYANTLRAPWYFDDHIRIVHNRAIHMTALTPAALMASIDPAAGESHSRDAFFRPVVMMSLAVNWYLSGGDVAGFHLVNILIHCLAALVLYGAIGALMGAPRAHRFSPDQRHSIALLASLLWALHPIQTQAVTYIIQRSTSLAGLFFIAGIYAYVRGRLAGRRGPRMAFFGLGAVCYLLGLGSKLNTVTLPLSWLLVEILFFQDLEDPQQGLKVLKWTVVAGLLAIVLGLGLLWMIKGDPLAPIISGYAGRPFTLAQRLMTEARVVVFYLSQLIFPSPDRFAFMHDVPISNTLVDPWTTLAAMAAILLLLAVGLASARRYKFLSLAILFFFLNHLVESSVIPLELLYEHRNYLPSMFLFLPLAVLIVRGLAHFRHPGRLIYYGLAAGTVLLIISLGTATYVRNGVWASERAFWEDVLVKAPRSARPYIQLAAYHEKHGRYDLALRLYARSLALYDPAPQRSRAGALNNMGTIFNRLNQKDAAIAHFQKALAVSPQHEIARHNLLAPLIARGRLDDALAQADILIQQNPTHPYYLNAAGYIAMKMGDLPQARQHLEKAAKQLPTHDNILVNLGLTMGRMADYAGAIDLLERARRMSPGKPTPWLSLIEVSVRAGDEAAAVHYADQLVRQIPLERYFAILTGPQSNLRPYAMEKIRPIVAARLKHLGASLN